MAVVAGGDAVAALFLEGADHAFYQRFLKACELYRQYVKDSEYLTDIQYDEARTYYEFNHFDKAIPLFKDISEKNSKHRLAIYAANLVLAFFNMIPIFPLDGSRILTGILPRDLAERFRMLEPAGPMILLGLILLGAVTGVRIIQILIFPFVNFFALLFTGGLI